MSKHVLYPNPMEDLSDCLTPKSGKVQSRKPQGLQANNPYFFLTQKFGKAARSTNQERCRKTHVIQPARLRQKEICGNGTTLARSKRWESPTH